MNKFPQLDGVGSQIFLTRLTGEELGGGLDAPTPARKFDGFAGCSQKTSWLGLAMRECMRLRDRACMIGNNRRTQLGISVMGLTCPQSQQVSQPSLTPPVSEVWGLQVGWERLL